MTALLDVVMGNKIMIFDDDEAILDVLQLVLSGAGYDVKVSNTSNQVIAEVANFLPNLILMDHQIPSIGGTEAVKLLREHDQFQNIPVLYISASNDIKNYKEDSGVNGYIKKPFDIEYLEKKIACYFV